MKETKVTGIPNFVKLVGTLIATLAVSGALASSASAVTIGTALNVSPATAEGCDVVALHPSFVPPSCTFFAPNTQTPPGNYVVTTGRIRTGPRTGPMVFTAVEAMRSKATSADGRPGGIICCVASGESQVFTPPPNSVVEVPINLPMKNTTVVIDGEQVEVINYLGITLLDLNSSAPLANFSMPATSFMAPALRAGRQDLMNGLGHPLIPLINGEFTPCAGAASAGRATASNVADCPGFRPGESPGPGTRGAGGAPGAGGGPGADGAGSTSFGVARRVRLLSGGRAARLVARAPRAGVLRLRPTARFRRLVGPTTRRATRGSNPMVARLTGPGRRALARHGRLRAVVRITYRPRGGKAMSVNRPIVFRRTARN